MKTMITASVWIASLVLSFGSLSCHSAEPREAKIAEGSSDRTFICFSPDSKLIAVARHETGLELWNVSNGSQVAAVTHNPDENFKQISFSKSGKQILISTWWRSRQGGSSLELWDVESKKSLWREGGNQRLIDGGMLIGDGSTFVMSESQKKVSLRDTKTRKLLTSFEVTISGSIRCSADGNRVAVWSDNNISVVDVKTKKLVASIPTKSHEYSAFAMSPDGGMLAFNDKGKINLHDVAKSKLVFTKDGCEGNGSVTDIAFSPDGKQFLSTGHDRAIRRWDTKSGEIVWKKQEDEVGTGCSVEWSPNGKTLGWGHGMGVTLFHLDDGEK